MQIQRRLSNNKIAAILLFTAITMAGLAFASVPLYDLFCRVTGIAGTPQISENNNSISTVSSLFDVSFDANIDAALAWKFVPAPNIKDLPVGKTIMINYTAENLSDSTTTGSATFNVTPLKAGQYFYKIECFCFSEQTLAPHEKVKMPVQFYIDPSINEDKNMRDVNNITLSYTMYAVKPSQ